MQARKEPHGKDPSWFAAPKMGEIIQTKDFGQPIKARIETIHEGRPIGGVRIPFFKVMATEIM